MQGTRSVYSEMAGGDPGGALNMTGSFYVQALGGAGAEGLRVINTGVKH